MLDFLLACIHLDPLAIVRAGGYIGVGFLIFAESGLLIGIFLPGDSLLFAAGLLAGGGLFGFWPLASIVAIAAILGDSAGYWFGKNVGTNFFTREESFFFKKTYVERTRAFYRRYGGRAVILARFVPIVRTLAPMLAGVGRMPYGRFLSFNALGGIAWGVGMTALGFTLGAILPDSEHYVLPLSLAIIALSFLPIIWNIARGKRAV